MRVHVSAKNVRVAPSLSEFIERRLGFALGRFASQVIKVVVRLHDLNGPRGGIDQRCRIDASVAPSVRKTVQGKAASLEAAICQAVDRIACVVRKDFARRRTRRFRADKACCRNGPPVRAGW